MVIGIECRTSNNPDAGPHDIPRHWQRFYTENILSQIPSKAESEVIALYCDYEGDYTKPYSLVIGCQVTSIRKIPEGMVAKIVPASTYAVFRAVGEFPKSLIETWKKIWQTNLERTYTGDFEVHGERSSKEVGVYIAIKEGTQ